MTEPPPDSAESKTELRADVDDPVAVIRRWEDFGGTWVILERDDDAVTVSLRRCDAGEEMHRLVFSDPQSLDWIDRTRQA